MAKIEDTSDEGIQTLIDRYRERQITSGGTFTLHELLLEQKRRGKSDFDGKFVFNAIKELLKESGVDLITYGQLHKKLYPGKEWAGNYTQSQMSRALDKAIYYCISQGLPIITVLVVRADERLSEKAVQNIYSECKDLGMDVGLSAEQFVENQIAKSRLFIQAES